MDKSQILEAVRGFNAGDFTVSLPTEGLEGIDLELANEFNNMVNDRVEMVQEFERVRDRFIEFERGTDSCREVKGGLER